MNLWKKTLETAADKTIMLTLYGVAAVTMVGLFLGACVADAREEVRVRKEKSSKRS